VDFGGTCRRLAGNGLCFRGSLALGTVCGKKLPIFGRYNSPSAKFAALLPNLVCNYLPSSQGGSVGSRPPPPPLSLPWSFLPPGIAIKTKKKIGSS